MPCGDWLYRLAIRGCLIVALLFPLAGLLAQEDKPAEQPKTDQPSEAVEQPTSKPAAIPSDRPQSSDADWAKPKCENPQSHDEADLCEQRRMSKASEDSVNINKIQIVIGIVTIFGLALTVHYARKAANAADEAAKHGRTAAIATVDAARATQISADVAERSARHIERPYVFIGKIEFEIVNPNLPLLFLAGGPGISVDYTLYNRWRTPAVVFEICWCIDFVRVIGGVAVYRPPASPKYDESGTAMIVISAGGESEKRPGLRLRTEEVYDSGPDRPIPIIFGYIRYRDVAGRRYQAGFGFSWIRPMSEEITGSGGQIISPYGGEAYNYDRELTEETE